LENKVTLNKTLLALINIYKTRGDNFKSVFIEMIIRKVLSTIINFADEKETIVKEIKNILPYINNNKIDSENEKIIKDYKLIRNTFYTEDVNIIDNILDSESDLSKRLKQEY
jgi:hypothetical protein